MPVPILAVLGVAAVASIGVGVGAGLGEAISQIGNAATDLVEPSRGADGNPSILMGMQETLSSPAILAPLITAVVMQSGGVLKALAANPEVVRILGAQANSIVTKRSNFTFNQIPLET